MFELTPPAADGLTTPEVGVWSSDKHYFLLRYIDAFTNAMSPATSRTAKPWKSLHYIDLFAGAGIAKIKENGLIWGSPLIAAQAPTRFERLHLCELNPTKYRDLVQRVGKFTQPQAPQLINADANVAVSRVTEALPADSLALAFLDPYGLSLHFETLRALSGCRVDLIIFFPDHVDIMRNWQGIYHEQTESNLDRFLGGIPWRDEIAKSHPDQWAATFLRLYKEQIKSLGYGHFGDDKRIALPNNRFLYKLIFCSKHQLGARLWNDVSRKERDGQGKLF
jgi:three-Cys-motif partner protein